MLVSQQEVSPVSLDLFCELLRLLKFHPVLIRGNYEFRAAQQQNIKHHNKSFFLT